jgi:predicted cupin superfamily sugar epimerase
MKNQVPQVIIPAGAVFGAEVMDKGSFTLMGCMVTPGFHFSDFSLISFSELADQFPDYQEIMRKLT